MMNSLPHLESLTKGLPTRKWVTVKEGDVEFERTVPVESKEEAAEELRKRIDIIIEGWTIIKNIYDKINLDEQDENTGKALLQQTKDLMNRFHPLFMDAVRLVLENPESPPNIPKELFELRDLILKNAIAYGELPAVKTYKEIGRRGTLDNTRAKTRDEWFRAGKPTDKQWFEKWFGSEEKKEIS